MQIVLGTRWVIGGLCGGGVNAVCFYRGPSRLQETSPPIQQGSTLSDEILFYFWMKFYNSLRVIGRQYHTQKNYLWIICVLILVCSLFKYKFEISLPVNLRFFQTPGS